MSASKFDFVLLNGKLGIIVATAGDKGVPDQHAAVWFGNASHDNPKAAEVWTVPEQYLQKADLLVLRH